MWKQYDSSSKSRLKKSLKIPKVQPEAVILRRTQYNDQMEKGTNKSSDSPQKDLATI
jgi:hypothetical protein